MALIQSISGLRATLGDDLTPETVVKYTEAFAATLDGDTVVIGRDGRPSGKFIEKIVVGTLNASGKKVINLGITPTPMVQLYTEHTGAVGGIAITASHNPKEWNGMKFIASDGVFLDKEQNERLSEELEKGDFRYPTLEKYPDEAPNVIKNMHLNYIFNNPLFDAEVLEKIRAKNLKVCVDAVNASGSKIIPDILELFGCEVVRIACDSSGIFPHTPEPIPANLGGLAGAVKEHHADLGIAVDPDADRLVLTDENGILIGEERTVTLATESVLADFDKCVEGYQKCVTVNYSTTRAVEDVAAAHGAKVFRSPVGEINVVKEMKRNKSVIGGEGSGGVIFPGFHYGRDSIIGTALILRLLAERDMPLSKINATIPNYAVVKTKIPVEGSIQTLIDATAKEFSEGKATLDDGIRIDFEKSWVQLRASNTEPIMRIIAEAETEKECHALIGRVKSAACIE
jgi:phosphomannomutase